jgi:hypothetical protein
MTPIKLELLAFCDLALTSRENRLSLINLSHTFMVKALPTKLSRFALVASFRGQPNTHHSIRFTFLDPTGQTILTSKPIDLSLSTFGSSHLVSHINHLPVHFTGEYLVKLTVGDQPLGQTQINVIKFNEPSDHTKKESN